MWGNKQVNKITKEGMELAKFDRQKSPSIAPTLLKQYSQQHQQMH